MAPPRSTVWDLEPHTAAKHAILRRYLEAWLPILSHGGFPEVLYLDGFAGPGRYSKAEPGSPLIAIETAENHRTPIRSRVHFHFVEKDSARAAELALQVSGIPIQHNFTPHFHAGKTFEAAYADIRDQSISRAGKLLPTFAFIDPFGWTGVPFSVVADILSFPSCEVLINFMYEELNRFISLPQQEENFDSFFGTTRWRLGTGIQDATQRNRFFHDLYRQQLREAAGAKYVRSFEMRNDKDVTDYYLFYATNNRTGMARMKDAMWKVDSSGDFRFSDATNPNQLILFTQTPDLSLLQREILTKFSGTVATVDEIEEFVVGDTAFRSADYKTKVLKPLELASPPKIIPLDTRRRGTYADRNLRLRFM